MNLARSFLRKAWKEVQRNHPFDLIALCLLPDHLHVVIRLPENDSDYALRWRAMKGKFT